MNAYEGRCIHADIPQFVRDDYEKRVDMLIKKMRFIGLTHSLVYADREHFSNMEYLCGYDPRYEEALLVVSIEGDLTLIVGNEGWAYSFISPLQIDRVLYQNFSLQGQPREKIVSLEEIFVDCKIDEKSKIGIIGFKFFEPEHIKNNTQKHDIPTYIMDELTEITDKGKIMNFTYSMTGLDEGIRLKIISPKEIAYYEYASNKASNCMINILKGLKPGISELEASINARYDAMPTNVFPLVNFGEEHVKLGLRSPDYRKLEKGDIITIDYGVRGSLICRSGLAVYDKSGIPANLKDSVNEFFKPYFRAMVMWYESLKIGSDCGETYKKVMKIVGNFKKFGVYLNPGHNISMDEWTNSPFYKGSKHKLVSGYYLQADVIASIDNPLRQAIMEDGVILADKNLRMKLKDEFPDVYTRIEKRRSFMKEVIGINLDESVLPLSNCQAVFHPYMLDTEKIFAIR